MKGNLKRKAESLYNTVAMHWKTPPFGKYVAYKEILAYSIGGMGVQFVLAFAGQIILSANSFLVGNTIGIKPMDLQMMAIVSSFIGFGITIARSYIIDNSKFKMGKFRPWLALMGIPTVIIATAFVWLPFETMSYAQKVASLFISYTLLQCFQPFYQQSYTDLANVISPISHERTDIVSVSSILYSLAPSITGALFPLLSKFTGGLNNINTYRYIHPAFALVGFLLAYFAVIGTKERIIEAKTHVSHFKFTDAFRSVAKNKYFWITSLAGWLGFLEGAVGVIIGWTFIYGYPDRMGTYSLATTLIGNASLWAMLICPFAIRKIGKRNLLIWCNVANVFFIGALYPLYQNLTMLIILYYLNGFAGAFSIVYSPGINADMRDYQQYSTGERIDGMFGAVGIIGSFVGMFTGLVVPYIYQLLGLEDNYDVLEVGSFREDMFEVLIIAAVIGAALNTIPYFFYDLTEIKQKGIVKVLKIRALFEDYGNGVLNDKALVEAIDLIDESNALYAERRFMTTKDDIKKAKRMPKNTPEERQKRADEIARLTAARKEFVRSQKEGVKATLSEAKSLPKSTADEKMERKAAITEARAKNKTNKALNDDISVCDFVVDEMNKYDTLRLQKQVSRAEVIISEGIDGIYSTSKSITAQARALPKNTFELKVIRSDAMAHARARLSCKKAIKKYYPKGIIKPAPDRIEKAEALPSNNFSEQLVRRKAIKAAVNELSEYNKSVKVLLDAQRMMLEKENYTRLDSIRALYDDAKQRAMAQDDSDRLELEAIEAQRLADLEERKQARDAKKNGRRKGE